MSISAKPLRLVLTLLALADLAAAVRAGASAVRGEPRGHAAASQPSTQPSEAPRCSSPGRAVAAYVKPANQTFLVWYSNGAATAGNVLVGCFDHTRGVLLPPTSLPAELACADEPPAMTVDAAGHIWLFLSATSSGAPGWIARSTAPHDVSRWERVAVPRWTHVQPVAIGGRGLAVLHGLAGSRGLFVSVSTDGRSWSEPQCLARSADSALAVAGARGEKLGVAFSLLEGETERAVPANLYYLESADAGKNWLSAAARKLDLPVERFDHPSRVYDYRATPFSVYVKDLIFDAAGRATVVYVTANLRTEGERPAYWNTARWAGRQWEINNFMRTDSLCDSACLFDEGDNVWRLFATSVPRGGARSAGGEVAMFLSTDYGRSWSRKLVTERSSANHVDLRRPLNATDGMYVLWRQSTPSARLCFATRDGEAFVLPISTTGGDVGPVPLTSATRAAPTTRPLPGRVLTSRPGPPGEK